MGNGQDLHIQDYLRSVIILIISNLYLTRVGLISGGIGRRGPESGWAPGGGAGGKGGSILKVRRREFGIAIFFCI